MSIESRSDREGMVRAGSVVAETLAAMRAEARPGITTAALDLVARAALLRRGARSAPLVEYGFPGWSCISVNDEIVHGIPGARVLRPGDVVKLDVTAELGGYVADAALTVLLPPVSPEALRLARCARAAFSRAMGIARAGRKVAEIGRAVESEASRRGFHVVRELTGHGVGRKTHEPPAVPNVYSPFTRGTLTEGLVLAVEPLLAASPSRAVEDADGWTIRTGDGSIAVHHEHTIVIGRSGPEILTAAA